MKKFIIIIIILLIAIPLYSLSYKYENKTIFMYHSSICFRSNYLSRIIKKDWETVSYEESDFSSGFSLLNSIYGEYWIWKTIIVIPFILKAVLNWWPYRGDFRIYKNDKLEELEIVGKFRDINFYLVLGSWEEKKVDIWEMSEYSFWYRADNVLYSINWFFNYNLWYKIEFVWIVDWLESNYLIEWRFDRENQMFFWPPGLFYMMQQ
jgi:hypothetical protein